MHLWWNKTKKISIGLLLGLFLVSDIFGVFLLKPETAYAQVTIVESQPALRQQVWDQITETLTASALGALLNGVSYFTRKLAYDTAVYVASGGKGQGALVFDKGFGDYLETTALDSAASAIEQFGGPAFNLCSPPDINTQVFIQVGLGSIYDPNGSGPQTRNGCKWSDLKKNWENIDEMYGSGDALSQRFAASLDVKETDFGIALGALAEIDNLVFKKQEGADKQRLEGAGFKPVTDLISGKILTPAQLVGKEAEAVTSKNQSELAAGQVSGIYGSGAWQILPTAASVFLNTLTSQLLKNILTNGLLSGGSNNGGVIGGALSQYASVISYNRQVAEKAFSYLLTGVPGRSVTTYDIVAEFNACPDNPTINNCIIDDGLVQVLERSRLGEPLTVKEAIDEGLLHADWKLISFEREVDNTNLSYCHTSAYCYSNLQKLRKVRILSLGFEIAAARSPLDNPVSLGQVVAEFSNCGGDKPSAYCHLIDPNWLIIEPDARCDAKVTGEEVLIFNSPERKEACVDISTCLKKNADGSCISYGYCTKEKNIWELSGTQCPAYYNTCRTFTSEDGLASSYLTRTLDFGACDANSVGCRAYSTELVDEEWMSTPELLDISGELTPLALAKKEEGRAQAIYFNDNIEQYSCQNGSEVEGCNAFYRATGFIDRGEELGRGPIYLKKAPDYLGCYDLNPTTLAIDWPVTKADLSTLTDNENRPESCNRFAQVCISEEVGCDAYTPADGRPEVTGIVGQNICPVRCVGYDAFKQEGGTPETAAFEPPQFPLYFIPGDGDVCAPQYAGCDEFTNIDEATRGGEGLEYYRDVKYCERPDGINEKAFYSWEGSEREGYVLKKHKMLQIDAEELTYLSSIELDLSDETAGESYSERVEDVFAQGSPAYADDTVSTLELNYDLCNEKAYETLINNPGHPDRAHYDCRALYDSEGNVYYRILDDIVTVSDSCQPLRKTISNVYEDPDLTGAGQTICEAKGGLWDSGVCKRCYRGGKYNQGSCIYWTIPGESQSCPASANGCRMYTGNTGADVEQIFFADFEPFGDDDNALLEARAGWVAPTPGDDISIELEATQVSGHSLKVERSLKYLFDYASGSLEPGSWYQLSFWARGVPQSLSIMFGDSDGAESGNFTYDPVRQQDAPIPVRDEWQEYLLGSVQYTGGSSDGAQLMFIRSLAGSAAGSYFIDNVRLIRMEERMPLIKNSWKTAEGYDVPYTAGDWYNTCDEDPTDGLPGSHLGCREYTRRDGEPVYLTSFERLCREEAVGCTPLYDTYNTLDTDFTKEYDQQVFNLWCELGLAEDDCSFLVGDETVGSCFVQKGETGCYVDNFSLPAGVDVSEDIANGKITKSTVIIPADTPAESPIYLTHYDDYICNEVNKGCQALGLQSLEAPDTTATSSYAFETKYFQNDPARYFGTNGTLCNSDLVGCGRFTSNSETRFFKDPRLTSPALCVYKDAAKEQDVSESGWFMDGIGICQGNGEFCKGDAECGEGLLCNSIGSQPCYSDYVLSSDARDVQYGLWSNDSARYEGFVGVCKDEYSSCTELRDPADTSSSPDGELYYMLYNNDLFKDVEQCVDGKASQKYGCVLFDMTESPNKVFNSRQTYENSKNKERDAYGLVDVVRESSPDSNVSIGTLDTNMLLKVNRGRTCGEWLSCDSGTTVVNDQGQKQKICYNYSACRVMEDSGECGIPAETADTEGLLTEKVYKDRDVSWSGFEYSGYSMLNKYHLANYSYVSLQGTKDSFLGYELKSARGECGAGFGTSCGPDEGGQVGQGGRCYSGACMYPINGVFPEDINVVNDNISEGIQTYFEPRSCKMYPETDSPFDPKLALVEDEIPKYLRVEDPDDQSVWRREMVHQGKEFAQVNVCQDGACSCEYYKVEYKNSPNADYWPIDYEVSNIPEGICIGGEKKVNDETVSMDGYPCQENVDCGDIDFSGSCSHKEKQGIYYGLYGFCLEPDYSRKIGTLRVEGSVDQDVFACLTWLPIQDSVSGVDIYNADPRAGYYPFEGYDAVDGGEVYCLSSAATPGVEDFTFSDIVNAYEDWIVGASGSTQYDLGGFYFSAGFSYDTVFNMHVNPHTFNPYINRSCNDCETSENEAVGENCPSGEPPGIVPYKVLMCNEDWDDPSAMRDKKLQVMSYWGYQNIGHSARLLRMDIKNGYRERYVYSDESDPFNKVRTPYTFAPELDLLDSSRDSEGTVVEMGTIMHPPRVWTNLPTGNKYLVRQAPFVNDKAFLSGEAFEPLASEFWKLDTTIMSADKIYPSQTAQNHVWKSDIESRLMDSYLNTVYFVPLAYPFGLEGNSPLVLDTSFKIPIGALRLGSQSTARDTANFEEGLRSVGSNGGNNFYIISNSTEDTRGELDKKGGLYSYVLDKGQGDSLLSFGDYNFNIASPSGEVWSVYQNLSDDQKERSEIYRRYVSVFYEATQRPEFIDNLLTGPDGQRVSEGQEKAPDIDNDPFSAPCKHDYKTSDDEDEHNWIAIGMDFNKDGEFLGYISRWCNGWQNHEGESHAIRFAVFGLFKNHCEINAGVYNAFEDVLNTNKAWTDRVWQYGSINTIPGDGLDLNNSGIVRDTPLKPFGSINLRGADLRGSYNAKLYRYVFDDKNIDGMPWSCKSEWGSNDCSGLSYANTNDENGKYDSLPVDFMKSSVGSDLIVADQYLTRLFAKYYRYNIDTNLSRVEDVSETVSFGNYTAIPPQIYALNTLACGFSSVGACTAGESNNVTINMMNGVVSDFDNDGHIDEDKNNDGRVDPLIGQGSYPVILDFFAFADDNHMPIKKVTIDWGDGNITPDKTGFYKNRKPLCESNDSDSGATVGRCVLGNSFGSHWVTNLSSQLTCGQDSDCQSLLAFQTDPDEIYRCIVPSSSDAPRHFGDSARACEAGYFRYSKLYTCTQDMVNSRASYVKSINELASDEAKEELSAMGASKVCVFKPRVQVLDNWGWCNGDCQPGVDGCYNDGTIPYCNNFDRGSYTEYKGEIIVIPR